MARGRIWGVSGAAALAMAVSAPTAEAGLLFVQSGDGQACDPNCLPSSYGTQGGGPHAQAFDDFTLSRTGAVTEVQWQGFYYEVGADPANPAPPATRDWELSFSKDAAGLPGAQIYSTTLAASQVTTTLLGVSRFNGPVDAYSFEAFLPTAFVAGAGATYWFSPLSIQTVGDPVFFWSGAPGSPGDAGSAQMGGFGSPSPFAPPGGAYHAYSDSAFSLSAVPEPTSWLLLAVGIGGLGAALRRRAQAAPAPI